MFTNNIKLRLFCMLLFLCTSTVSSSIHTSNPRHMLSDGHTDGGGTSEGPGLCAVLATGSTGWMGVWRSAASDNLWTPLSSCGVCLWPTRSSGWRPPEWREPQAHTGSSPWSRSRSPAVSKKGGEGGGRGGWRSERARDSLLPVEGSISYNNSVHISEWVQILNYLKVRRYFLETLL